MYSNVNLDAHLSALLFLGSAARLLLLLLSLVVLFFWRRIWLHPVITGLAVLVVSYGILLLAFSLFSRERTLARGEEKYFCELDCHLAYSVQSVERAKTIADATASGEFYIVKVRTRFDESTTASWRPRDVPVSPVPLNFTIVDGQGRALQRSLAGQSAWDASHGSGGSLLDPLRPGEAFENT